MKNKNVTQIAKMIGKSKATVSRVMNNCPGVDSDVREEILEKIREIEKENESLSGTEEKVCLSLILPDNPKFFWQNAARAVAEYKPVCSMRSHSYAYTYRGTVLGSYMDQIENSGTQALILAGLPDEALAERLERFAEQHLLIQVCDYTPIRNSFFVGSNFYEDGRQLGLLLLEQERGKEADCHVVILQRKSSYSGLRRGEGFLSAVKGKLAVTLMDEPEEISLYPSYLAREIAKLRRPVTHIFSPSGLTVHTCDAIRKLKGHRIGCLGFENPPRAKEYLKNGTIRALAVQDVAAQIVKAIKLAECYILDKSCPEQKFNFIPCDFLLGDLTKIENT